MMTSKKVIPTKKIFYSKSPFMTVSESIGQQIIEDSQRRDMNLVEKNVITESDLEDDVVERLQLEDYDEQISNLKEELDILDVTIDDLKQNDNKTTESKKKIGKLIKTREAIQQEIDKYEIMSINKLIEND